MKNVGLLVWFTQLGISVAVPLIGAVGLSVWLYNRYDIGVWVILLGVAAGLYGSVDGFRGSLKAMRQMAEPTERKKQEEKEDEDGSVQKDCNS